MAFGLSFDHEGEAFTGHRHTDQSMSFGMESQKLNHKSANFSYDLAGANGSITVGGKNTSGSLKGDASLGHLEGGYSVDYSSAIPQFSVNAGADTAKFSAEARYARSGMEHKVASLNLKGPGASASASAGGKTVLPVASAEAHTVSPSASVGFDNLSIRMGAGNGPQASAGIDINNMKPDSLDSILNPSSALSGTQNSSNAGQSGVLTPNKPYDASILRVC